MHTKQILPRFMTMLAVCLMMMTIGINHAWSADIHSAKAAGQIGEQQDGYLGVVGAAPSDIDALVKEINQKRQAVYRKIASKHRISLQDVEKMAAKKAIEKTPHGEFIRSPSGAWIKK